MARYGGETCHGLKESRENNEEYINKKKPNQNVSNMTDEKVVHEAIENLLNKTKAEFPKAEKVFREIFSDSQS